MGLGVFVTTEGGVTSAGGFLIQSLPPSEDKMVDLLIENIRKIPSVTDLLRQGQTPEEILGAIFTGVPYYSLGRKDLFYRCTCSRGRIERVLISLGADELLRLINEQGEADVTCEFCGSRYPFSKEELEKLRKEIKSAN
jgi:molecular chaperone Hsp33